jgi:hypothetical protein
MDLSQPTIAPQPPKTFGRSDTIAGEINTLHNELSALGKTVLEKAIRIGDLLTVTKKTVRHGDWLKWCANNLDFGTVMAQRYMRIFENKDGLLKASQKTHLTITDAYASLAKKSDREGAPANGEPPDDPAPSDSEPTDPKPDGAKPVVSGQPKEENELDKQTVERKFENWLTRNWQIPADNEAARIIGAWCKKRTAVTRVR